MSKRRVLFTAMALSLPLAFWLAQSLLINPVDLKGQLYIDGFCLTDWGCDCNNNIITCGSPGTPEAVAAHEICNNQPCNSQLDCSKVSGCTCAAWGGYECEDTNNTTLSELYMFCGTQECTPSDETDCPYHPPTDGFNSGCDQCCDLACNGSVSCIQDCYAAPDGFECGTCCGGSGGDNSTASTSSSASSSSSACPSGQAYQGGQCVCQISGQTIVNGQCQCPTGQTVQNNQCQCSIQGQTLVNGQCQCPGGQQVINNQCQCPGGQQFVNNQCVCPAPKVFNAAANACQPCPINTTFVNGVCEEDFTCLEPDPDHSSADYTNDCRTQCAESAPTGGTREDDIEQCVADCVCECNVTREGGGGQGDSATQCYEACMSDNPFDGLDFSCNDDPNCCRGSCIGRICPSPDSEDDDLGTGDPECFPVPLCGIGNECRTWTVSPFTCECVEVQLNPDSFCEDGGSGGGNSSASASSKLSSKSSSQPSSKASSQDSSALSSQSSDAVSSTDSSGESSQAVSSGQSALSSESIVSSLGASSEALSGASSQESSGVSSIGHLECLEESCIWFPGEGENLCESDEDCLPKSSSSSSVSSSTGSSLSSTGSSVSSVFSFVGDFGDFSFNSSFNADSTSSASSFFSTLVALELSSSSSSSTGDASSSSSSSSLENTSEESSSSSARSTLALSLEYSTEENPQSSSATSNVRLVAAASICGNGILDDSEECDDSNRRDNDGCSTNCLLEIGICGDGIVQKLLGEQCEPGVNVIAGVRCARCRYVSETCGDGKVDPGEECDDGTANSTTADARCRPDCSFGRCGDAILDSSELCDDGNRLNGDGCDRFCQTETEAPTQVAGEFSNTEISFTQQTPNNWPFGVQFPGQPSTAQQALPYQLPLAQLQPLIQGQAPAGDTGPAAVVVIAAGAASGFGYMRKKRRR